MAEKPESQSEFFGLLNRRSPTLIILGESSLHACEFSDHIWTKTIIQISQMSCKRTERERGVLHTGIHQHLVLEKHLQVDSLCHGAQGEMT